MTDRNEASEWVKHLEGLVHDDDSAADALRSLRAQGWDLLRRTAELPDTEHGLLCVLAEYRYAVFAFCAVAERL